MVKESKTEIEIKSRDMVFRLTTTSTIVVLIVGFLSALIFSLSKFEPHAHEAVKSEALSGASASGLAPSPSQAAEMPSTSSSVPSGSLASATSGALMASVPAVALESGDSVKQKDDGHYNENHVDLKKSRLVPGTHTPSVTQETKGSHNINSVVVE